MPSDKCEFTFSPATETGLCHHPRDRASFGGQRGGSAVHGKKLHHHTVIWIIMNNLAAKSLANLTFSPTAASLVGGLKTTTE